MGHGQGIDLPGLQGQHRVVDALVHHQLRPFRHQGLLHQLLLQGGGLGAHLHAREALGLRDGVLLGLGGDDRLLRFIVAGDIVVGQKEVLRPVRLPGETGDGHIHGPQLHRRLAGVEAHGLQLQLHAQLLGQIVGQGHVEPHELVLPGLAGVHKLHGRKVRRHGHGQHLLLLLLLTGDPAQHHGRRQHPNDQFFHVLFLRFCSLPRSIHVFLFLVNVFL